MSDVPSDTPSLAPGNGKPAAAMPEAAAPVTPASVPAGPAPAVSLPRLVTVNGIQWASVLDFTHLFGGFRLAINPAKLALALLTVLIVYGAGRTFDLVWGAQAYDQEIQVYAATSPAEFRTLRDNSLKSRDDFFKQQSYESRKADYLRDFQKELDQANQPPASQPAAGSATASSALSADDRAMAGRRAAADRLERKMNQLDSMYGHGVFDTLLGYETDQFSRLVACVIPTNRLAPTPHAAGLPGADMAVAPLEAIEPQPDTILGCIAHMLITGPHWLFTAAAPMQWRPDNADTMIGWIHMMSYRALYLASLMVWALIALLMFGLTGAAITRLSALELAGVERAPLKDVFFFAAGRLWTFIKAPVTPFLIILAIGLVLAAVALLGAVPYAGPVFIGLFLFAFLGVCFILMLLLLGVIGGFNLLYPAIAVEGADSFDAMSRSFAYAYARPWRLGFYTLASLIYGVITFLFVTLVVFLILLLTHTFVGWGMNLMGAHDGVQSGMPALETIWPAPHFQQLVPPANWHAMTWAEYIGAILAHFWAYLLVGGIAAYVLSYYFSTHTIIYLLLRRSVDGQNLKEVFLEEKGK